MEEQGTVGALGRNGLVQLWMKVGPGNLQIGQQPVKDLRIKMSVLKQDM